MVGVLLRLFASVDSIRSRANLEGTIHSIGARE